MKPLFRTVMLSAVLLLIAAPSAFSQSNQVIDRLLKEDEASFDRVLYLVQSASGEISEDTAPGEAVEDFEPAQWNLPRKAAGQPITLGEYSQLLVQAFDIKAGLMYRLFPGPRYAAREIEYLGFLRGSGTPGRSVSGSEVMHILRELLALKGGSA